MKNKNITKRLTLWALVIVAILMIPFLTKAPWTESDYVFAGFVLFAFASLYELITLNMTNKMHRIVVGGVILGVIGLVIGWAAAGP